MAKTPNQKLAPTPAPGIARTTCLTIDPPFSLLDPGLPSPPFQSEGDAFSLEVDSCDDCFDLPSVVEWLQTSHLAEWVVSRQQENISIYIFKIFLTAIL